MSRAAAKNECIIRLQLTTETARLTEENAKMEEENEELDNM